MKSLAWLTDIHLNFVEKSQIEELCRTITLYDPDSVLISGDISEVPDLESHLSWFDDSEILFAVRRTECIEPL